MEIWGLIEISSTPSMLLSNKNPCKDVIHIGANAEEYYYHIELMCNEDIGIEYGIQANGEEAKELCKEGLLWPPLLLPDMHIKKRKNQ